WLAAALLVIANTAVFAQDTTPAQGQQAGGETDDADKRIESDDKTTDRRLKAKAEEAQKLRIKRQTEFVSTVPVEGEIFSYLAVPQGLAGDRGLVQGRLLILPTLTVGATYSDNIEASEDERDEDLSAFATGTVRAQSLLARHSYGFDATATTSHSFQEDNDDYVDWAVGADGRLDLTRRSSVTARATYTQDTEDDSSAEAEGEDNDSQSIIGNVGYQYGRNRFGYLAGLGVRRQDFSGPGSADRDNTTFSINQRVSLQRNDRLTLFVTPQYSYTAFDVEVADDGDEPDTHAVTGLVGFDFAFRAPVLLTASAGYTRLFFEDPDLNDVDSVVGSGTVGWLIDPLTTFDLTANHTIEVTTLDDATATTTTSLDLNASRQIGLNTSISGQLGATYIDFQDIDRSDIDLRAGTGLTYRLTSNLFLGLAHQYTRRLSEQDGAEFYENQTVVGLTLLY
ncbi:MAG: outer membrane beta-barrel protein, partial [Pseudomonadota bacterium]